MYQAATHCLIMDLFLKENSMRQFLAPISSIVLLASLTLPVSAIQFSNGETAFSNIPILSSYGLLNANLGAQGIYDVKVEVPASSDIGLGRLLIELDNSPSTLPTVDPKQVSATAISGNNTIPVDVTFTETGNQLIFTFPKPIPAGSTIDLRWTARNLREPGVYLFGVTAYPTGTSPRGQFLGFARLNIGTNGDGH
jgi:Protein of unknown function (DUF2808)